MRGEGAGGGGADCHVTCPVSRHRNRLLSFKDLSLHLSLVTSFMIKGKSPKTQITGPESRKSK